MKRGIRRPAGLRIATQRAATRPGQRQELPPAAAMSALVASPALDLAVLDLGTLRRLWARSGGASREFSDSSIELLSPSGERVVRGAPIEVGVWLRARFAPGRDAPRVNPDRSPAIADGRPLLFPLRTDSRDSSW